MASHPAAPFEHGEGDDAYLQQGNESFAMNHRHLNELHRLSAFQQVTTKVPPSYDGRSSWFAYEDAIDDWCDVTGLDNQKRGPALRNRLEGLTPEAAMERGNDRVRDQHAQTIPITANLVALIFVSLSDLTQDQRQVLTSLMAHRNRVLADYSREVYLEIFRTTKTSVDNPLLAPSGHGGRKTFLVIDEGYLDNHEGYWVEDEEDGAEGFLEADEDAFWVYDEENYTWFQRRFQGRKMKRGFKGGLRKGKGKGGKGPEKDASSRRGKAGQWQDSQWQDQSWDDWSWYESEEAYAAKGKGKKGEKGKGKGKSGKDGKDGKSGFKGGTAQLADAAQSGTTTATTFYVDYMNPLNFSFMATTEQTSFIAQPLTPTSMVLDLACTRAMASRVTAQDLMKFCDQNSDCGIWYYIAETTSQFTFANSESTKCNQKLVVCVHDREYVVQSTEFDIVEQGHVPILMSLPQMRNLRLHLDLSRLMWNFRFDKHKNKSSFLTYFTHYEYGLHQKTQGSSSQEEVPEKLVFATDDEWAIDEANMELIRVHKQMRKARYEPKEGLTPIPLEFLDTKRKTIMEFHNGKSVVKEDDWRSGELPTAKSAESWKSRTK
eukprot:s4449_g6.t3